MASHHFLGKDKARIVFRFAGRQYARTIAVRSDREAERAAALVEEAIADVARGRLAIPEGVDPGSFLLSGGRLAQHRATNEPPPPNLAGLFAAYEAGLTAGSKAASSLQTERVHRGHFLTIMGGKALVGSLDLAAIQGYVDRRAAAGIARDTITKELVTLLVAWRWAAKRGHAPAPLWARKDLTLPKGREKPPFRTWDQIERSLAATGPKGPTGTTPGPAGEAAWESLWLDQDQTLACLDWVAAHAARPFIPALFAFAAYTGARRSEMIRSEREDWDFPGGSVLIRQKKADTSRDFTTRPVPIHPALAAAMTAWFAAQPGSRWAVSPSGPDPLNPRMATKYFREAVAGGPWRVLHGWHVFRHSLASNLAGEGVDQRIIDQVLGHHTDEMARRYRHLLPQRREHAIKSLFTKGG
jgi:integrase